MNRLHWVLSLLCLAAMSSWSHADLGPSAEVRIKHRRSIELNDGAARSVVFSPDGRAVAACGDHFVQLFDPKTGEVVEGGMHDVPSYPVEIRDGGDFVGEVRPQKRQYLVQKNWMTEAGIKPSWNKDLFVALGDQLGNGSWSVRIQYKPLIRFIWLGALVMAIGGLVSVSDRRYRLQASKASKPAPAAAEPV